MERPSPLASLKPLLGVLISEIPLKGMALLLMSDLRGRAHVLRIPFDFGHCSRP